MYSLPMNIREYLQRRQSIPDLLPGKRRTLLYKHAQPLVNESDIFWSLIRYVMHRINLNIDYVFDQLDRVKPQRLIIFGA